MNELTSNQSSLSSSCSVKEVKKIPQSLNRKGKNGRFLFEYEGRTIYEWEQNLDEVIIYIKPPPGVTRQSLIIIISNQHLYVGLKDVPTAYLDEDTFGPIKLQESTWFIDDGEINITLVKMNKAEAWDCALKGKQVGDSVVGIDEVAKEELKKKLMLERFQQENPHFDFSNAEFNGNVPNAREFMGGVKYS